MRPSVLAFVALTAAAGAAQAGKHDLKLLNLCAQVPTRVGGQVPECSWVKREAGTGRIQSVTIDAAGEASFRSLVSELGAVMAPRLVMPADTIGMAGFQLSGELGVTRISSDQSYWNGVQGVSPLNTRAVRPDEFLTTVGVFVRKGLWLPLPAFEIGTGVIHLLDSQLLAFQGYAKLALHEGFQDWPIPSFAVRGSVSHLTGTDQLRMTTGALDLIISKRFGAFKTARVEPYAGWSYLLIQARSGRIDATPACDAWAVQNATMGQPLGEYCAEGQRGTNNDYLATFSFPDQAAIVRQRVFAGMKLKFATVFFAAEYALFPEGNSRDDRRPQGAKDESQRQEAYSLSAGFDF